MKTATSLEGYKHTNEAKLKMLKRFEDKSNHPMYGKQHSETKKKIIDRISKHPMERVYIT